ncbi:bloodthirsty-related gene family, member 31 isoform X1 [Danio rerio]|uniref:Bloodthirsty-related gene family, member 31 isoform X1 n=1 Tax=Danio rerio TaxID=7955 RepID=A0AC58IN06_DANRE
MVSSCGLNEELQCSICLDVFTDPVTTPCGHNFCRTCLDQYWTNTHTCCCPICKEKFSKQPDLKVNIALREVVEHLKQESRPAESEQAMEDRLKKIQEINHSEDPNKTPAVSRSLLLPFQTLHMSNWMLASLVVLLAVLLLFIMPAPHNIRLELVQKHAVDVTLDHDTANPFLILSDDGKQVSLGHIERNVPENPERFNYTVSVLGKQGFSSGKFYYEVQVKGKTDWTVGLARESINRKGQIRVNPENGFWTVWLRNGNQYEALDSPLVSLSLWTSPEKVGVFVDYEKGLVSFYNVNAKSHIYSFTAQTFTETLYTYFSPGLNDDGKNSKPLIITPVVITSAN